MTNLKEYYDEIKGSRYEDATSMWLNKKIPLSIDMNKLTKWYDERGPFMYLMFGITYQCQCNCRHCCTGNYHKEKANELSTDEIKDVLDQAAKPLVVNFFGGEPTLRTDLMELINYATKKSMYVFCDTNGVAVTKDYAQQLKDSGLEQLYVSIDSPHSEEHDRYRGFEGCFDKAIQAIKNALDVGLNCLISTYVTRENWANGDFKKVVQIARDLNATGVRYLLPEPAGKWLYNVDVKLTPEEEREVLDYAWANFPFINRDFYFQTQQTSQCAGVAYKEYIYISPYGELQPCCFMPLSFGNVREEPLKDLLDKMWNHPMYNHSCLAKECPMLNLDFRKDYIDPIPRDYQLPFRM